MHSAGNDITARLVELQEGPWDQAFVWIVPLEIRSKSNFRRHSRGAGRNSWSEFKDFEAQLKLSIRRCLPPGWQLGASGGKVEDRPAIVSFVFAKSGLDSANLSKSVLDACQGTVFHNDASVRSSNALGVRGRGESSLLLAFARLSGKASLAELIQASNSLQMTCLPFMVQLGAVEGTAGRVDPAAAPEAR
jgi:hypothetical protein